MSGTGATASVLDKGPIMGCGLARPEFRVAEGLTPYPEALAAMEARVAAIRAGEAGELVWLVEHPPTYTAGTSAPAEGLLDPRFPVFAAGRGGQWTYHGPGQRTAYVMLDLGARGRDVRRYVQALEEWVIRALWRFNVSGERRDGRVGIWVDDRARGTEDKIGAIGVRVTRWVTWHGDRAERRPGPQPFRRDRAVRHQPARGDQPAPPGDPGDDGGGGCGADGGVGRGVRLERIAEGRERPDA